MADVLKTLDKRGVVSMTNVSGEYLSHLSAGVIIIIAELLEEIDKMLNELNESFRYVTKQVIARPVSVDDTFLEFLKNSLPRPYNRTRSLIRGG